MALQSTLFKLIEIKQYCTKQQQRDGLIHILKSYYKRKKIILAVSNIVNIKAIIKDCNILQCMI